MKTLAINEPTFLSDKQAFRKFSERHDPILWTRAQKFFRNESEKHRLINDALALCGVSGFEISGGFWYPEIDLYLIDFRVK